MTATKPSDNNTDTTYNAPSYLDCLEPNAPIRFDVIGGSSCFVDDSFDPFNPAVSSQFYYCESQTPYSISYNTSTTCSSSTPKPISTLLTSSCPIYTGDGSDYSPVPVPFLPVPAPMDALMRQKTLSDANTVILPIRIEKELSRISCFQAKGYQGIIPTNQPVARPSAAPTLQSTPIVIMTFSFTLSDVLLHYSSEEIDNKVKNDALLQIVRDRLETMVCLALDTRMESCHCDTIDCLSFNTSSSMPILTSQRLRRTQSVATTVMSVKMTITLNTIDFVSILTPLIKSANSTMSSVTLSDAMYSLTMQRLNNLGDNSAWKMLHVEFTNSWFSEQSQLTSTKLVTREVINPPTLVPTESPTRSLKDIGGGDSDDDATDKATNDNDAVGKFSVQEVVGITLMIGALLLLPMTLLCCYCYPVSESEDSSSKCCNPHWKWCKAATIHVELDAHDSDSNTHDSRRHHDLHYREVVFEHHGEQKDPDEGPRIGIDTPSPGTNATRSFNCLCFSLIPQSCRDCISTPSTDSDSENNSSNIEENQLQQ